VLIVREIEAAGITSRNGIAAELNRRGVRTARGRAWTHVQFTCRNLRFAVCFVQSPLHQGAVRRQQCHSIIYLIGVIVVIMFILSLFGLR
jgi:hypothetical protein